MVRTAAEHRKDCQPASYRLNRSPVAESISCSDPWLYRSGTVSILVRAPKNQVTPGKLKSSKREAILAAMLDVVVEQGFHDAPMSLIAGRAGASADLMSDVGWREVVEGCAYVLHVASPFPSYKPKHEDELIVPAREGTLRVLRAARDAGVRRWTCAM